MNGVHKDAVIVATFCLAMNTAIGVGTGSAVGPMHAFDGLSTGLGVGIATAPVMIMSLVERKPLLTAPLIIASAWALGGLVMLGSGGSQAIGKLILFITVALACLLAVTLVRRESESQPVSACTECGYDLFGIQDGACPECGKRWKASDIPRGPSDRPPWNLGDYERWMVGFAATMSISITCLVFSFLW